MKWTVHRGRTFRLDEASLAEYPPRMGAGEIRRQPVRRNDGGKNRRGNKEEASGDLAETEARHEAHEYSPTEG